ncbi:hypothetical protein FKM82_030567, partial [Ascaphus truei]
ICVSVCLCAHNTVSCVSVWTYTLLTDVCSNLRSYFQRTPLHGDRPKQKRHRCRNPNKLDVNSLTGEERVQLINRRNARKVGGAFAPPLKDLCRFLKENPEYGVAPEWGDVVKQSVSTISGYVSPRE